MNKYASKPRYAPGDKVNGTEIKDYLGYLKIRKPGKQHSGRMHTYQVACNCGCEFQLGQDPLVRAWRESRAPRCKPCVDKDRGRKTFHMVKN